MLRAIGISVLFAVAVPAIGHADVGTKIDVSPRQAAFLRRYYADNKLSEKEKRWPDASPQERLEIVERHLGKRILAQLNQSLRMFSFSPAQGDPYDLAIHIDTVGEASWPTGELIFTVTRKSPGTSTFATPIHLAARCPAGAKCDLAFDKDGWLKEAIDQAVKEWNAIGKTLRSIPFNRPVRKRNGFPSQAEVRGARASSLGIDEIASSRALFEARESGITAAKFLLCGEVGGSAVGPFIDPSMPSGSLQQENCAAPAFMPPGSQWAEFYLLRYWP